jgi:hypothetical protein
MYKFLENGTKVKVLQEAAGGFLCQHVVIDPHTEEEFESEWDTYFYKELYDIPPLTAMHEDYRRLEHKIENLKVQLKDLLEKRREERSLIQGIKESEFLQNVNMYLNGDFEYVVSLSSMSIMRKSQVYLSPYIKITNTENKGFRLYTLQSSTSEFYDDREIQVFKTKEEAFDFLKSRVLKEFITRSQSKTPLSVLACDQWMQKLVPNSKELSTDSDIITIYRDVRATALIRENKTKRDKLEKELKDKTELLNSLKD